MVAGDLAASEPVIALLSGVTGSIQGLLVSSWAILG